MKAFQLFCQVSLIGEAAFSCRSSDVSRVGPAPSARHRVWHKEAPRGLFQRCWALNAEVLSAAGVFGY